MCRREEPLCRTVNGIRIRIFYIEFRIIKQGNNKFIYYFTIESIYWPFLCVSLPRYLSGSLSIPPTYKNNANEIQSIANRNKLMYFFQILFFPFLLQTNKRENTGAFLFEIARNLHFFQQRSTRKFNGKD